MARCKSAVQGVKSTPVQVWEGKFLQCLSSMMLWVPTQEKITLDERLNTSPLAEEYSSSLSEAWLLGGPNQSSDSGGQSGVKPFYI